MVNVQSFFDSIFPKVSGVPGVVSILLEKGVTFDIGPWSITAKDKDKGYFHTFSLTQGTTALMKNLPTQALMDQNRQIIREGLAKVWIDVVKAVLPIALVGPSSVTWYSPLPGAVEKRIVVLNSVGNIIEAIKAIRSLTLCSLLEAKNAVDHLPAEIVTCTTSEQVNFTTTLFKSLGCTVTSYAEEVPFGASKLIHNMAFNQALLEKDTVPSYPVSVAGVVGSVLPSDATPPATSNVETPAYAEKKKPSMFKLELKYADTINQKVYGSTPHSTYNTIAIGPHIKVAARLSSLSNTLSIRAEISDATEEEKESISKILDNKGTHYSLHVKYGDIPPARVIGAVLMDMGFKFTEQVHNGKDLIYE